MTATVFARGCDISRWQDDNTTSKGIDFAKMASTGLKFVFIRCSNGMTPDEDFKTNWAGAKAAGILRGAYHFFQAGISARDQALAFVSRLAADPGELPPVLDLEHLGFAGNSPREVLRKAEQFITLLDNNIFMWGKKKQTIIYTNYDIIKNYFGDKLPSWFLLHDLWIAHYGVTSPNIGTQYKRWTFWQQTDRGDGITAGVESKQLDLDVFNGTVEELYKYCGIGSVPVPALTLEQRITKLEEWAKLVGYVK